MNGYTDIVKKLHEIGQADIYTKDKVRHSTGITRHIPDFLVYMVPSQHGFIGIASHIS